MEAADTDHEESDDDTMTFHNILALLMGRQSIGSFSSLNFRRSQQSSSDSDSDNEGEFWRYQPRPAPNQPQPPDCSAMRTSEITVMTEQSQGLCERKPPRPNITLMLADRCINGSFSLRNKRLISGQILPNNPTKVAQYKSKVFCGTHAKDGEIFMTACQDRKLRIYDCRNEGFKLQETIEAQDVGWSVLDVTLSPDGDYLVYSSWSDSLHQVSLTGYQQKHEALPLQPDDRQFAIFSVVFSCDQRELLGGANDGHLYIYDRGSNRQSSRIEAHEDDVNAVCFVDGTTHVVASGADDGLCKIWDRRALRENDPQPVGVLAGHTDGITYIDPRGDGRHLITNSKDQSIKLWDIRKFSQPEALEESRRAVSGQSWDYRWQRVPKRVFNKDKLEGDSSIMTYTGHTVLQTLIRCHFSPQFSTGQRFIYTGCAAGRVIVYDALRGHIVKELSQHSSCVRDVSWHPYNMELFSSSWDFTVLRWTGVESEEKETNTQEKEEDKGIKKMKFREVL